MSRSIANIQYLEAKNLAHWMKSADAPLFQVIDVRGSDYVGGHIKGCWNYPYRRLKVDDGYMEEMYKALNKKLGDTGSDRPLNAIFHCAQS
ncbi:Rhodanese-like domain [Nakaseomyces glabratus]